MRFKINLEIEKLHLKDIATETSRALNKMLGDNNKWHDMESKPYTCSLITGGEMIDKVYHYNNYPAFFYLNTNDDEVMTAIFKNSAIEFEVIEPAIFKAYNMLSIRNIIYNRLGERRFITEENKADFLEYVKNRYSVDLEIIKIKNHTIMYKNGSHMKVSDILVRCVGKDGIENLFETGVGGSCSIGFGFVSNI